MIEKLAKNEQIEHFIVLAYCKELGDHEVEILNAVLKEIPRTFGIWKKRNDLDRPKIARIKKEVMGISKLIGSRINSFEARPNGIKKPVKIPKNRGKLRAIA